MVDYNDLVGVVAGDVDTSPDILDTHSRDASIFQVSPQCVVFPKNSTDIQQVVRWASEQKAHSPELSITMRAAGTCMSGGSLNNSIIVDTTRYMNQLGSIDLEQKVINAQPGVYYRDMEAQTLPHNLVMPIYPASKAICAIGGMFANNCGGEHSLQYGKASQWVLATKHIFADGKEYDVQPLSRTELQKKINQDDYEGNLYQKVFDLVEQNYDYIQSQRPSVSKNSAGYYLWNVWNRDTGIFDLNQLLVGSQGTLGITTNITWKLQTIVPARKLLVVFLPELSRLGDVVTTLLAHNPETIESYDDASVRLAVRFFPDFITQMGIINVFKLGVSFLPEVGMLLRGGIPKLVLIAEFVGQSDTEIDSRIELARTNIQEQFGYSCRIPYTAAGEEKYWRIRRESFNLLRKHLSGKRTAPFIDDLCVHPRDLPVFLPELQQILHTAGLTYTVAGHAGNGNFHIIPLMDFSDPKTVQIIMRVSDQVYALVARYNGSITAEHNDGIIRTPYLHYMFEQKMLGLFEQVKEIFDPLNIFNPGKKVGGSLEYLEQHIVKE